MTERQELGSLEAMLFAHAEPVETARLADALRLDVDETAELLQKLQKLYDERESGMVLLYFEPDRWQMTTRPYYGEMVKRILDTRRNAPLSPAALEVLAVIAYNQPVSRSFIAVSYTHLDVYKRQVLSAPKRQGIPNWNWTSWPRIPPHECCMST